ncbi:MAG: hypothetical protein HKL99_13745 [Burkholderiales bacterium]|nr:hypothetical protein [Burkholderiales bacterium]
MHLAYLILAHDQPAHLREMIARLITPDSQFYVHIDRKSRLEDFQLPVDPRIHVMQDRVRVFWGDYSQVEAILRLMRAALSNPGLTPARLVLLSGADYPVRSNAEIHAHFRAHDDQEFIDLVKMPSIERSKPLSLLTTYQPRNTALPLINRLLQVAQRVGLLPQQRDYVPVLGGLQPYAGSTWWALSRGAAAHVIDFLDSHPDYAEFFRHTVCPDESCIHTILGNSSYATGIRPCLTYTDWSTHRHRPEPLTLAHAEFLTHAPARMPNNAYPDALAFLFARKFVPESRELLRLLNAVLDGESATPQRSAPQHVAVPVPVMQD